MEKTCRHCGRTLIGKYCHACGQKDYSHQDKSLHSLLGETFHFMTHVEGTLPTTLKTIVATPGKYTADYCSGIRKPYYKPVSLFLLLVVAYLLFPVLPGLNMELGYYPSLPLSGPFLERQITHLALVRGWSAHEIAAQFHHESEKLSKLLLLLLIPLTALALRLVAFRKNVPAYDLFIFATEINVVVLLLFLLMGLLLRIAAFFFNIPEEEPGGPLLITAFFVFITISVQRFFGGRWWLNLVRSLALMALYAFCFQVIYKFILFEATYLFL